MARRLYCRANMKIDHRFATAVALATVTLASAGARGGEVSGFGIAVDGYMAPTWDHSVSDQQTGAPERASRGKIGVSTLISVDEFALGGVVDGMPGIFGEGRLTVGGVVGWQPRIG